MITKIFLNLARNSKFLINNNYISKNYNNQIPLITNTLISSFSKKSFCEKKTEDSKVEKTEKSQKKEKTESKKPEENKAEHKTPETLKEEKKNSENKNAENSNKDKKSEEKKSENKISEEKKIREEKKPTTKENTNTLSPIQNQSNSGVFDNKRYISLVENLLKDPIKIMEEKEKSYQEKFEKRLLPNQKKYIDKVAKYFSTMNIAQINHSLDKLEININNLKIETPIQLNKDLPTKSSLGDPSNPTIKDFSSQKELMITLSKWFINQNPGFGLGSGSAKATQEKAEVKAENKEIKEKKVEKEAYDLELTAFDAAKKIGIIKEVRTLTNLGLKEVD